MKDISMHSISAQKMPYNFYRLDFLSFDVHLQSVRVPNDRFWVNANSRTFTVDMYYTSPNIQVDDIIVVSGKGIKIDAKIEETLEMSLSFKKIPDIRRFNLIFDFPVPDNIYVCFKDDENPIFSFIPNINFPEFIYKATFIQGRELTDIPFKNFVETGTLFGHTCIPSTHWFENVYSIELSDQLWNDAQKFKKYFGNLNLLQGNSGEVLPKLIPSLKGPTVFFLDAHWSGDSSVDWSEGNFKGYPVDTAHLGMDRKAKPSSEEQVPLLQELNAIYSDFSEDCIVIIDDWGSVGCEGQGFDAENWTHLSQAELTKMFSTQKRTLFHHHLDKKRYIVGIKAIG